jgi:heterotetrameric sarcosine oxidase gamma subunit
MKLKSISAIGASFGTAVPIASFGEQVATLSERSDIGSVIINCAVGVEGITPCLTETLGFNLPAGPKVATSGTQGLTGLWLTPRSWLVLCKPDDEFQLIERVNGAFPDKRVNAAAFSDYLAWFALSGPKSLEVLSAGGFVSFDTKGLLEGRCKRTLLAGIPVVLQRSGNDEWLLGVERSRASYFSDWLQDTAMRERRISSYAVS